LLRLEVVWQQDLWRQEVGQVLWNPQRLWRQLLNVLTRSKKKKHNAHIEGTREAAERVNHTFFHIVSFVNI
jgi:hypothetical protein